MRRNNLLHKIMCLGIILLLVGCNPSPRFQPGHYTGKPGVSFDLSEDGNVQNFKITIVLGLSTCTISVNKDVVIQVEEDGSFIVAGGEPGTDGKLPMNGIVGRFTSPTTVEGAYSNSLMCGTQLIVSSQSGTWTAQLAESEGAGVIPVDGTQDFLIMEFNTSEWASALGFTPDGNILVAGLVNGSLELLSLEDGTSMQVLPGHTGTVKCIAFSSDGQFMATGAGEPTTDEDPTVKIWRTSDWTLLNTLQADGTYSLAFSPDGNLLAAGSGNGSVYLWQVSDGVLLHTFEGHDRAVEGVAFSPKDSLLASGSYDDTIRIWQINDGSLVRILEPSGGGGSGALSNIMFLDSRKTLAALHGANIYIWDITDGTLLRTMDLGSAESIAYSPDGRLIASISYDGEITLWKFSDGSLLATLTHSKRLNSFSIAFSPDGETFASGNNHLVRLWSVKKP